MYDIFSSVVSGLYQFGTSLGVGASTVVLVTWLIAQMDGTISKDEGRILQVIYKILRIAMFAIGLALVLSHFGHTVTRDLQYAMQWSLFGVLCMNAVMMTYHKMPMRFGPSLQAGTWYAQFLITVIPIAKLPELIIALIYLTWIFVVYLIIRGILNVIHDGTR
ncbi:hypothetical protein A3C89_01840 [Candidatus Kaiserbacteria bacterium RIFCSPHIGHO2_02_FULL_50_50]|uniref:Uncharacterized protein n=1 Tax=Candidatus Kaiserbacteria bacterium RIFCSPHIGHO2_02_FULL_50_50 TaxID=1798492 RepID=A0A1F6DCG8_9BACT|nr:MAG: hypothetical protein A3C89_01840 [Candidatus Kaiserbacteria bacterium RIFCSPHIGHO2_02_FULL_50_50]OGG89013.1 MAG: hypothetical protein A3G62_04245 [Candidatus Kaiserbacteria bacterium RIFCSPLOWO2_12_FULL_50_10]